MYVSNRVNIKSLFVALYQIQYALSRDTLNLESLFSHFHIVQLSLKEVIVMNVDKNYIDYESYVAERITSLRVKKDVAARAMSLDIGQSRGYIAQIERKKALPSMAAFFYICEFFNITPKEFFDDGIEFPAEYHELIFNLKKLDNEEIQNINNIVKSLVKYKT